MENQSLRSQLQNVGGQLQKLQQDKDHLNQCVSELQLKQEAEIIEVEMRLQKAEGVKQYVEQRVMALEAKLEDRDPTNMLPAGPHQVYCA